MKTLAACMSSALAASALGCAAQEQREAAADPAGLVGNWAGTFDVGDGVQLRLRLVVSEEDGVLRIPVFWVDRWNWERRMGERFSFGLGAPVVSVSGDTISVPLSDIDASYTGTWPGGDGDITGTFTQAGHAFSLVLERASEEAGQASRPQTPEEPFPYLAEDVTYANPDGGHTLAGTFTRPSSGGPFPTVILISGSGRDDRGRIGDGHRPFLVLADYLTRRGIAVLRYDDRGIAESTGTFETATSADFASDALAGVAYLKTREDVSRGAIGLVGFSEGGLVAPMAAVESPDVNYIVMMAGPGVNGERIHLAQASLIPRGNGASEEEVAGHRQRQEGILGIRKSEADPERAGDAIAAILRARFENASPQARAVFGITNDSTLQREVDWEVQRLNTPWYRYFLAHEPGEILEQVSVPVLAVIGTKDLYVPHEENLREIEAALKRGGNTRYEIHALPGINHFFQHAVTGTARESETIEETIAEEVLELIADWIVRVTGG